ncbi:MAG: ribosome-associated ATPase/putative transporter RbbA [Gammaproteobacteria bacterium]|uniref:ribosome-associated ATPase/putative transporter RbbA n=1 Tax=Pseudomonas sp. FSL W5-0299 TaxID=1917484 RepID=UPI00098B022A|nr:ribosome-associated ATPase/putative transporter RbbA [Pseudomonas sp. FSL W5-0299]MBU0524346.1 ribosome-associated ATPase/putative transporter RbbA [Gammaproteobacteria bacterium]MBU0820244.1 ribosome-associated ATPase/putative transporter RbbA [Gammaproteobacteria bacterium]MBU0841690.1 ribosome-associated ATPase/putative transporter RbbA [Gammaproteobacteria bacterium]MBU1841314.1 ribosome-associated ATPase/putative transporter RbbA [Gammaproteobacteria bacterium]OOL39455.1 multidrug ABC 
MTGLALQATGLQHRYGQQQVLTDITFSLPAGTRCGLIGPDGAGKSSLLGLIAGVKTLQDGQLDVLSGSIQDRRHRISLYSRIAFMPQGLGGNLYPELSISENIHFFATLFGLSGAECDQRMQSLLLATDLQRFAERPAGKLSGGMKQKLGLCCALIHEPDLLILDEPTTGVDPLSRRRFWELIDDVRRQRPQLTLLVATAYMEEAEQFEHCLMLDGGKLIAAGLTRDLGAATPSGKLDEAFTHFQGDSGRDNQPLVIPARTNATADIAIEAHDLTLRFGDFTAVDKVSFAIGRGEIFGFLGSNGCGKTTTMKVLTGLIPASEGRATLLGNPVNAKDLATRKRVGFMSQSFSLYGELSVRQNLDLHARLFDLPKAESAQRIDELIQRFNLGSVAHQPSGALPLGLRQRLSLAVAVLHRPEVLILDEPTSGVDPAARDDFWRLLIELSREQGVTIFLSTHFMNEAQRCDRISLMHAGKVLACDTPAALQLQFKGQTLEAAFVTCLEQAQGPIVTAAPPTPIDTTLAPVAPMQDSRFSFGRLRALASREGKELLRDKVRMAFALLGAMFMMVIFGYGISLDVEKLAFAVYDQDQTPQSRAYLEAFRSSRYFDEQPPISDPAQLHRRLQRSEIKLALEVPPGFGRDLFAGRQPAVAAWLDGGMPFRAETSRNYVEAVHQGNLVQLAEQSSPALNRQAAAQLETRFRYNQDVVSVNAIGPGVMALILAFIPAMLTALGIVREKELGSITNFYATPLTRLEFLLGKQAPYLAISLINLAVLTAMNRWLFGVPFKGSGLTLAFGGLLYVLATTSMGLLISAFTRTQIAAILGTMIITSLPTIQFSGLIVPRSSLDGAAAVMGMLFPAGYFLDIAVGTFTKALDIRQLWPQCLALFGFFLGFTGLSLAMLKKQEA